MMTPTEVEQALHDLAIVLMAVQQKNGFKETRTAIAAWKGIVELSRLQPATSAPLHDRYRDPDSPDYAYGKDEDHDAAQ